MKTTKFICKTCKKEFYQAVEGYNSYGTSSPEAYKKAPICPFCGSESMEEKEPVTKEQLKQYRHLKAEIEREEKKLRGLNAYGNLYKEAYEMIENNKLRCLALYMKLQGFIYSIDDSFIRQVFELRYIEGLSWPEISVRTGNYLTDDALRIMHNRYIEKCQ